MVLTGNPQELLNKSLVVALNISDLAEYAAVQLTLRNKYLHTGLHDRKGLPALSG